MAKQGINPLEQHVEKGVAGLAALLFAFVVFNYVISTPVMVRVAGQSITPGELDRKLADIAQGVADACKQGRFIEPAVNSDGGAGVLPEIQGFKDSLNKVPHAMISPVRWGTDVKPPEIKGLGGGAEARHSLAKVGAPTISGVYSGVTYAGLVAQPLILGEAAVAGAVPATSNQDVVWAFLRLNFDAQEQYEIFRQSNYSREQANLVLFVDVQAQRQRVYPDGSTGPWEDIKPYRTVQANYPQTIAIREDGTMADAETQTVKALFDGLVQEQQRLLYPLPQILGGDPFTPYGIPTPAAETSGAPAVAMPKQRPAAPVRAAPGRTGRAGGGGGGSADFRGGGGGGGGGSADFRGGGGGGNADFRGGGGGEARPARGAAAPPDKEALRVATQAVQDAKKAFAEKHYVEALQHLERAKTVPALQRQVADLAQQINTAYAKWKEDEDKVLARKANDEARNAEIWLYDMQALAGKTCRYRARVLLFNVYAHPASDRIGELKNLQDGAQIALVGEWSVPSDPIAMADSRHFFLTGSTPEKELATVDVFRFQQGRWFKDSQRNLAIGDAIGDLKQANTAAGRVDVDYRTGRVVVDIGNDPTATIGSDNKGAKLGIKRQASPVLVSMDADGAIEPRWLALDRACALYKELQAKAAAAVEPLAPTASGTPR